MYLHGACAFVRDDITLQVFPNQWETPNLGWTPLFKLCNLFLQGRHLVGCRPLHQLPLDRQSALKLDKWRVRKEGTWRPPSQTDGKWKSVLTKSTSSHLEKVREIAVVCLQQEEGGKRERAVSGGQPNGDSWHRVCRKRQNSHSDRFLCLIPSDAMISRQVAVRHTPAHSPSLTPHPPPSSPPTALCRSPPPLHSAPRRVHLHLPEQHTCHTASSARCHAAPTCSPSTFRRTSVQHST